MWVELGAYSEWRTRRGRRSFWGLCALRVSVVQIRSAARCTSRVRLAKHVSARAASRFVSRFGGSALGVLGALASAIQRQCHALWPGHPSNSRAGGRQGAEAPSRSRSDPTSVPSVSLWFKIRCWPIGPRTPKQRSTTETRRTRRPERGSMANPGPHSRAREAISRQGQRNPQPTRFRFSCSCRPASRRSSRTARACHRRTRTRPRSRPSRGGP